MRRPGGGRRLDGQAACPEAEVACEALELCVDKAAALTCAETVLKLLGNAAKGDAKFRRVRLGNKAVQERILAVDGGLEALCAAGFELAEDGDETVLLLKDGFDAARLDAALRHDATTRQYLVLSRGTTHKPAPTDADGFAVDESVAPMRVTAERVWPI